MNKRNISGAHSVHMAAIRSDVKRSSRNLYLAGVALGILIGIPIGIAIVEYTTDRVTVITTCEGQKT